ncbi:hypothetical protein MD484_g8483, partial [Candolleomyces efflorescens]
MVDLKRTLTSSELVFAEGTLNRAPIVELTAMIEAILALKYLREVQPTEHGAPVDESLGPESHQKARRFTAEQYDLLVAQALEFCNDPQGSTDLKTALRKAQCIVRGLDSILSQLRETRGDLKSHPDLYFFSNRLPDLGDLCLMKYPSWGMKMAPEQGFERTGTKPFMALELLQAEAGEVIQRPWAHDLESVIWCLVWYVIEGRPPGDWRLGTYHQVGDAKVKWIRREAVAEKLPDYYRTGTEHLWAALADAVYDWLLRLDQVFRKRSSYSDKANLELIQGHFPCPKRPEGEEWDWMEFGVKQEDIREVDRIAVEVTE